MCQLLLYTHTQELLKDCTDDTHLKGVYITREDLYPDYFPIVPESNPKPDLMIKHLDGGISWVICSIDKIPNNSQDEDIKTGIFKKYLEGLIMAGVSPMLHLIYHGIFILGFNSIISTLGDYH